MFERNHQVAPKLRYQVEWCQLPLMQFENTVQKWLFELKGGIFTGPSKDVRKEMAAEFLAVLSLYELLLKRRATEMREAGQRPGVGMEMVLREATGRIALFERQYALMFNNKKPDLTKYPVYASLQGGLESSLRQTKAARMKLDIIERKLRLIDFWVDGLNDFPPHIEGLSLFLLYLGNMPMEKVKAVLHVLLQDAAKLMGMADPTRAFKVEYGASAGFSKSSEVEWTEEDFKTTVRAEVAASYGVKANFDGSLEITGLKAKMSASAFAGARAKAGGELSYSPNGIEMSGEVEVMVGIELKLDASVELGDIFMLEVGAEAFAGALAKAEAQFSLTYNGMKLAVEAEVFAGARITGTASFGFKIQGYEILKGTAKGSLSAGIGASFKLDIECSTFGGTKFAFEADATLGVGMGGGTEVEFHGENLMLATNALYYRAYNYMSMSKKERYTYWEYFHELKDNLKLFEMARGELVKMRQQAEMEYNVHANRDVRMSHIEKLADTQWRQLVAQPIRRARRQPVATA